MQADIIDKLRRFDAYPKTLEDFRVKTFTGATVTIISGLIMFALFISELHYYLTPEITEELFVDVSRGEKLSINVDIVFPKISCSFLSVDAMDTSGEQHININDDIYKRRLNQDGTPIDKAEKQDINLSTDKSPDSNQKSQKATLDPSRCESCYGGESPGLKCCNTCDDVKEAYRIKGWALTNPETIAQCIREGFNNEMKNLESEGCQIFGSIEVNRVGGNFHVAPGRSFSQSHIHVHDIQPGASNLYNTSHIINHLSFGRKIPGMESPLNGVKQMSTKGGMMYQYYVKIVPTRYLKSDTKVVDSNQFSVTKHEKQAGAASGEQGIPGLFVMYEFSPMMVKYSEKQKSFMHFLTGVCAIIGGVFTVAGLIDSFIYHSSNVIQKKIELGKAT